MHLATIGFTKSSAEHFFSRLMRANVTRVIDVRLNNTSQLSGFAKSGDLEYFLKTIANVDYTHEPLLAPTDDILTAYKKEKGDWSLYQERFLNLLAERRVEERLDREKFFGSCLLCSEATPHHCHRRLAAEYLNAHWGNCFDIKHL